MEAFGGQYSLLPGWFGELLQSSLDFLFFFLYMSFVDLAYNMLFSQLTLPNFYLKCM